MQRGAGTPCHEHAHYGRVESDFNVLGQAVVGTDLISFLDHLQEMLNIAKSHHHPFGLAGRARSKNNVGKLVQRHHYRRTGWRAFVKNVMTVQPVVIGFRYKNAARTNVQQFLGQYLLTGRIHDQGIQSGLADHVGQP